MKEKCIRCGLVDVTDITEQINPINMTGMIVKSRCVRCGAKISRFRGKTKMEKILYENKQKEC